MWTPGVVKGPFEGPRPEVGTGDGPTAHGLLGSTPVPDDGTSSSGFHWGDILPSSPLPVLQRSRIPLGLCGR